MPNFFIIGAQKAGTTSLYHYLEQHPEVFMSPDKEPHFFDQDEGERPRYGGPGRYSPPKFASIDEYQGLFRGVSGEKAVGEASPSYLYLPGAPRRIKRRVPEARLIAILRHPAERAYSAFLHAVKRSREPLWDFREALREEEARVRDGWHHFFHYRSRGFYHEQLSRYYELFGREQVRVYLHEELSRDPAGVTGDAFRFLGVDDSFEPDTSVRYNPARVPWNRAAAAFLRRTRSAGFFLKRRLPFEVRQPFRERLFAEPPPLDPRVREELVECYREDVLKLEGLIGRDLSAWLDAPRSEDGGV